MARGLKNKRGKRSPIVSMFELAGRLKEERRKGWVTKLRAEDAESVADHSYRTALMAMVLSDSLGLDAEKAMRLALLHDLPESIVGDATPEERSGRSKTDLETKAMRRIVGGLPPRLGSRYLKLWGEFLRGGSPEAKLVREVDKLEMAFQAAEYTRAGYDATLTREFLLSARARVRSAALRKILAEVEF